MWHMHKKLCYRLEEEPKTFDNHVMALTDPRDIFVKSIKGTKKITHRIDEIVNIEPEPQIGGAMVTGFLTLDANSVLYKAQLYRYTNTRRKPIRWEEIFNTKINSLLELNMTNFTHSKVKGFMWLFYTHDLPVGARLRGKEANTPCKICGGRETIDHMASHCPTSKTTWKLVAKEWFARTGQESWFCNPSLSRQFFNIEQVKLMWREQRTLRDITLHNIWKNRCEVMY